MPTIVVLYSGSWPEVEVQVIVITTVLREEESRFQRTLDSGLRALRRHKGTVLSGRDVFAMSDTHGFPRELTVEEVGQRDTTLSEDWVVEFDAVLQEQRDQSRAQTRLGLASTEDRRLWSGPTSITRAARAVPAPHQPNARVHPEESPPR